MTRALKTLQVNDAWGAVISRDVLTWFVLFVDDRRHAQVFVSQLR